MESQNVSEFFKLDPIDKQTLFWLMDNKPSEIESWIKYVARDYCEIKLDPEKLFEEIKVELV